MIDPIIPDLPPTADGDFGSVDLNDHCQPCDHGHEPDLHTQHAHSETSEVGVSEIDRLDEIDRHEEADSGSDDELAVDPELLVESEQVDGTLQDEADLDPPDGEEAKAGSNHEGDSLLSEQAYVQAEGGKASALVGHFEALDVEGSLSVVGVKHQLGSAATGDYVHVWVGRVYVRARITDISAEHDRFRAEIPPDLAKSILTNAGHKTFFESDVRVGERVEFTHMAGVPGDVMRQGTVAGAVGGKDDLFMLTGADCGPGASGSVLKNDSGQVVGQVMAYDPKQHLTLVTSADQIISDLRDFAADRNLEERASPVSYGSMNTVCDVAE